MGAIDLPHCTFAASVMSDRPLNGGELHSQLHIRCRMCPSLSARLLGLEGSRKTRPKRAKIPAATDTVELAA
ncbi:MAG: hypothetical protein JWN63_2608 [Candidatus Acidoferrum typicum]|nr:hypothetical protein [Candidatus Acidoferrum typicum]